MRHLLLALPASLLLLSPVACGDEGGDSGDPTKVSYAPALGVDLTAMELHPNGLYTQDVVVGTGTQASFGRTATVHYSGWLPSGARFDSSYSRNEPFSFTVGQGRVIEGWDKGVDGMRVGGKRRLVIPSELGYGSQPVGSIPPNSVLVFDVELLAVQ